jgi:carboxyl-terminal processing protease
VRPQLARIASLENVVAVVLVLCGACGGGGNGSGSGGSSTPSWTAGVFPPSSTFQAQCASPRTGTDPATGQPYPDVMGSIVAENSWLRSWTHELYLWYREVPDLDPAAYSTTSAYFDLLKTSATTPSGQPKDKFHFTYPTTEWEQLSQSGVQAGYGATWLVVRARAPRLVVVAYTEPGSPARKPAANLVRGAEVVTVDGADLVNATDTTSVNTINEGLYPSEAGASHTFGILDPGTTTPRTVTMVSANVTETPVQNVETLRVHGETVGYMLFNDHIATAERELVSAFQQLAAASVSDLVLDIRYNGGGYLDIASEVAYMIAGPGPTSGQTFENTVFNDQYPDRNPFTGAALTPVPFHSTAQGFTVTAGQPLPALNLPRVAVLTSASTCSASESIINSLRGVGVQVVEVGTTTCGKPYGFYPMDNCGTTYFSINFQGVNARGFGDYPDGFSPANTQSKVGVAVPGCSVGDDVDHDLGDPAEGQLSAALGYLADGRCPAPVGAAVRESARAAAEGDGLVHKSPWRENRILRW